MGYSESFESTLWILVGAVAMSDVLTTYYGIESGLEEKNPIGETLIYDFGFEYLFLAKAGIILFCFIINYEFLDGKQRYISPMILLSVWLFATVLNLFHIYYIHVAVV